MKALIVDDELHVREALRLLVSWSDYGIDELLEAEDGESAVKIIMDVKPKLVFTDMMMPGMGGVGLLEWIESHAPRTKTVVISGHDDFKLVRTAVKCGGLDYILKPIDPDELQEAVKKAALCVKREEEQLMLEQKRSMEVNQIKPIYWDRLISGLIEDPSCFDKIKGRLAAELWYSPDCTQCRAAVLSLTAIPQDIMRKFASDMDLVYFSLTNICNEYMKERQSGYAFRHGEGSGQIVLLFWRNTANAPEMVKRIHDGIVQTLKGRFDFGLGRALPFPKGAGSSYREAVQALRGRNLLNRERWIHELGAENRERKPLPFHEYEEQIRFAIRSSSPEHMQAAVERWFEELGKLTVITMEQLELWGHEYSLFQSRLLKEILGNESNGWSEEDLGRQDFTAYYKEDGTFDLLAWKEKILLQIEYIGRVYSKHLHEDKHVIYDISKYIQAHYKEDITLQDIAERFFLSREYISRKFKQEFKENLSDYVVRIRMEKAKLLLMNPEYRVSWVAEQVGYQDEKYFSKVFKKVTGFTPGEYRKNPTA